jgi:hypothetical protein
MATVSRATSGTANGRLVMCHEDLQRIVIGLANDGSNRTVTMKLVEEGGITWRNFYYDRGPTAYRVLNMVGQFVPGITEDNLMSTWRSTFGEVTQRMTASSDRKLDNQITKRILVAFTRKPAPIPIWASWEMMVLAGGRCYPSLNFWSSPTGTGQMHGIDALIDLTTVRKEVGYPDLWKTTVLELLGNRWKLEEAPIFYQAAPASVQNQACQTDDPPTNTSTCSQTDVSIAHDAECQTEANTTQESDCQTDTAHIQSDYDEMREICDRIISQANDGHSSWILDELDMVLLSEKEDTST